MRSASPNACPSCDALAALISRSASLRREVSLNSLSSRSASQSAKSWPSSTNANR